MQKFTHGKYVCILILSHSNWIAIITTSHVTEQMLTCDCKEELYIGFHGYNNQITVLHSTVYIAIRIN